MILNHLENPFLNSRISDLKYKKMAETHLKRLQNNNQTGRFEALISSTQPAYQAFEQFIGQAATEVANKKGKTQQVNTLMSNIKKFVSRKEGMIADKVEKETAVYLSFFPVGLKEYTQATKT